MATSSAPTSALDIRRQEDRSASCRRVMPRNASLLITARRASSSGRKTFATFPLPSGTCLTVPTASMGWAQT